MTVSMPEEVPHATDTHSRQRVPNIRPRDAASIILVDRLGAVPRVLMGQRSTRHAFMPDFYVFPGGRRDARDHALPYRADLDPRVMDRLRSGVPGSITAARARALALAALRELQEETGLVDTQGTDLSRLRYIARAITPPGNVRRYDTRFFLAFLDETDFDVNHMSDSNELQNVGWLDIATLSGLKLAAITRTVLGDATDMIAADPSLPFGSPVNFYFMRHGRFVRSRL